MAIKGGSVRFNRNSSYRHVAVLVVVAGAAVGAAGCSDAPHRLERVGVATAQFTWVEQQKLLASNGAASAYFGISVSLDGDTALVGAYRGAGLSEGTGSAYVFVPVGGVFSEQQKLLASDGAADDHFGFVSLDGDTALVGAPGPIATDNHCGAVYVFVRNGGVWTEQQKLTASDAAPVHQFGAPVFLDGDTAFVGDTGHDDNGYASGSAHVFVRSGTVWTEQQKLLASDGAPWDGFGLVAADGNTALVGAYRDGDLGMNSGSVYVFVLQKSNGDPCTVGAECASGFCVDGVCCDSDCGGGDTADCLACSIAAGAQTDGACGPSTGNPCDDADDCTQVDVCQSGVCSGSKPVQCTAQDECHDVGNCDPQTGACDDPEMPDGTPCANGTCHGGVCVGEGGSGGMGGGAAGTGGGTSNPGYTIDQSCGCRVPGSGRPSPWGALALVGLGLTVVSRRRERRWHARRAVVG